ncbi:transporter substrate-binding domain-containing protein [uncultured Campylobacter sp.]|uniref:transporter substrate-binding domain-containing protein n=1 Tax=uncultured Campylobacter sp. TaxID=218934 RepID=UPI0025FAF5BF|nr:transporter substrate-binding domain-containing protein [uncultured Campylobacter sp.]
MKKILLSILLGAGALCANSLADIKQAGEIRIGLQDSQPPFSFDDNGTLKGFEVDLANELVKNLFGNKKIKIDFIPVASKDRVPSLEQNKVDLIVSKLTVTKDRVQKVDFSYPYYSVQIGVLSRKDDNISRIDQIAHKKF